MGGMCEMTLAVQNVTRYAVWSAPRVRRNGRNQSDSLVGCDQLLKRSFHAGVNLRVAWSEAVRSASG